MRNSIIVCAYVLITCATLRGSSPSPNDSAASPYASKPILRAAYWEGYSTALREQLVDLAYGSSSIVNHGAPHTEQEVAWFAGYRDGIKEASKIAQKFFDRQLRQSKDGN